MIVPVTANKPNKPSWLNSMLHTPTADYLSNPNPALGETVHLRLLIPSQAKPDQVVLRTIPNGEQQFTAMKVVAEEGGYRVWEAALKVNEPRVPYRFAIQTEGRVWWMNALAVSLQPPVAGWDFQLLAGFDQISWLSKSVFYQIFPDRFANGDPENDPVEETMPGRGVVRKTFQWGQATPNDRQIIPFFGGDLAGIIAHLDYLEQLGVNALYLNPIFTAFTNHRYDVINFHEVDPILGGNQALISLREALSKRRMRYILDIVPNHCGILHPWFQTAQADCSSDEFGYFYFGENNKDYTSWMNFGHMPKLNYASVKLRQEMIEGENAAFVTWLKPPYRADGWRVDVGNMLGRHDDHQINLELLRSIRSAVKRVSPDAYLLAENFFEAANQLQGDGWDAVMNYAGFTDPLLHWLTGYRQEALGCDVELHSELRWDTGTLVQAWQTNLAAIPWQIALQQFNLLDSHDTSRLLTRLHGNKELCRLAAVVQFTFPGVPCVYYGDEIGLENIDGLAQRNCFPWDESKWDTETLAFYQKLIALRRRNQALAEGELRFLHQEEDLIVFARVLGDEWVIATANRAEQAHPPVRLNLPVVNLPDDREFGAVIGCGSLRAGTGWIELPELPQGGEIWL